MSILLEVLAGPSGSGLRIPAREGLIIGRRDGEAVIGDPKMSSRHARLECRNGVWHILDLGSSNKIKVGQQRVDSIELYVGLQFVLGSTTFIVRDADTLPEISAGEFEFTGSIEVPAEAMTWKEILQNLIDRAIRLAPQGAREEGIRPLPRVVRMEISSGPQAGTIWRVGYWPRVIGAASFDFPLLDSGIPDTCFSIESSGGKVLLVPLEPEYIKCNGRKLAGQEPVELRSGDRLEVGRVKIRVVLE